MYIYLRFSYKHKPLRKLRTLLPHNRTDKESLEPESSREKDNKAEDLNIKTNITIYKNVHSCKMKAVTIKMDSDTEAQLNKIRNYKNESYDTVIKQPSFMTYPIEDKNFFIITEAKKRLKEIKQNPSIEKTEKGLNSYLKKREFKMNGK